MFDYHGYITGFYGYPIGTPYTDRPFGMANFEEGICPTELPDWAPSWWRIVALVPPRLSGGKDPYAIYDRWGNLLYLWDQNEPPHYSEVVQVCTKLLCK